MTDNPDTPPSGAGRAFWQSLDELAQSPDFLRRLQRRFPDEYARLAELAASVDRRRFLQLTAATLALSGLAACGPAQNANLVVPYAGQPQSTVPEKLRLYATALTRDGLAVGVLSRNIMARPIKIEGNPDHPASLGGTDAILQAAILDLYDPDRSRWILNNGEIAASSSMITALVERFPKFHKTRGEGLRILTETVTSPTLAAQFAELARRYPRLRRHHWQGGFRDAERTAMRRAFGRVVAAVPKLEAADVILAIDSDLLDEAPGHLVHARAFARRRRELESGGRGNRLYAIESTPTLTGANADHRFVVAAAQIETVVRALAAHLGVGPKEWASGAIPSWVPAVAADLARNKGRALVQVGPYQSVAMHLLGHAINAELGAVGRTVAYLEPPEIDTAEDDLASLSALVADMRAGKVDTLLILGGNPAFTAPPDLGFAKALKRVALSLHLATHVNETTRLCSWHVPEADQFERWSDARAFDGTATIVQPQIEPLYGGWSAHELLAVLTGELRPQGWDIVRATWQAEAKRRGIADFEAFWHEAVRSGVVPDTRSPAAPVKLAPDIVDQIKTAQRDPPELTVLFRLDPWLRDGRHANNGWLQELPRPLTKLTWDNAVLVAPALARKYDLDQGRVVGIEAASGRVEGPVWIMPGQAEDAITVILGFGRRVVGRVGAGTGFDGFPLRPSHGLTQTPLKKLTRSDRRVTLATTQLHQRIHNPLGEDEIVRSGTVEEFRRDPHMFSGKPPSRSLYPDEWHYPVYAWAMAINLSSCIGCEACVAACEAENNIPIVGKDQVLRDRQMHWLRVDRYYRGSEQAPEETLFQPVPCMQCENAPCEVVCPVEATVHDSMGINDMVYNRCVGTRFCSNNCPYKVRRFNWFNYAKLDPRLSLAWNPDLSVRAWGVMEKCTYCIQRIREAVTDADRDNRRVRDGEVVTACAAACPTEAIVFGNQNDPDSAVRKRKDTPLDYGMLAGLNTRPRTTYQARLTNPNPAISRGKG